MMNVRGVEDYGPSYKMDSSKPLFKKDSVYFSREIPGTPNSGTPLPISFPYHSHTSRDSYGSSMGMGVPLFRVPGISLEFLGVCQLTMIYCLRLIMPPPFEQRYCKKLSHVHAARAF